MTHTPVPFWFEAPIPTFICKHMGGLRSGLDSHLAHLYLPASFALGMSDMK